MVFRVQDGDYELRFEGKGFKDWRKIEHTADKPVKMEEGLSVLKVIGLLNEELVNRVTKSLTHKEQ